MIVDNLVRRFGHAATDRQDAYLTSDEIETAKTHDPLISLSDGLTSRGIMSRDEVRERFLEIDHIVQNAFERAAYEPGFLFFYLSMLPDSMKHLKSL